MHWKRKPDPVSGQRRIKHVWLLFPRCINDECRWLEGAWIEQEFVVETAEWAAFCRWVDRAWADGPAISTEPG